MRALSDTLNAHGYVTRGFSTPLGALDDLYHESYDLVLTDLMMPEMDGVRFLGEAWKLDPNLVGIVMTGQGSIESAVEAMKAGALDFIQKPFKLNAILPVLSRAMTVKRLRREKEALARQVRERTSELEASNRDLEAFAQSISHDLRAPIRGIRGYLDLILADAGSVLSGGSRHYLKRVSECARQMSEMIDALLHLSRIGRQSLAAERVNVEELVRQIVTEQLEQSASKNAKVTIGSLPACDADPALLRQVWVNLIGNAFKYSSKREQPVIQIGWQPAESVYYVKDNGAGFDMNYASELFQPFRRLHHQQQFEGSGIGLSTVQRIVERHGGRIWADSIVDKGATFYFSITSSASRPDRIEVTPQSHPPPL